LGPIKTHRTGHRQALCCIAPVQPQQEGHNRPEECAKVHCNLLLQVCTYPQILTIHMYSSATVETGVHNGMYSSYCSYCMPVHKQNTHKSGPQLRPRVCSPACCTTEQSCARGSKYPYHQACKKRQGNSNSPPFGQHSTAQHSTAVPQATCVTSRHCVRRAEV
jgi:hypothetical protein